MNLYGESKRVAVIPQLRDVGFPIFDRDRQPYRPSELKLGFTGLFLFNSWILEIIWVFGL
jgi:hypothetical protein